MDRAYLFLYGMKMAGISRIWNLDPSSNCQFPVNLPYLAPNISFYLHFTNRQDFFVDVIYVTSNVFWPGLRKPLSSDIWTCGAMDNASDYGSEDSRFESWQVRYILSSTDRFFVGNKNVDVIQVPKMKKKKQLTLCFAPSIITLFI